MHISMQLVLLSSQLTQICIVQCLINIIVLFHIVNVDETELYLYEIGGFHNNMYLESNVHRGTSSVDYNNSICIVVYSQYTY